MKGFIQYLNNIAVIKLLAVGNGGSTSIEAAMYKFSIQLQIHHFL